MTIEIKGLKELERKFDDLSRRAGNLDGEHNVPVAEVLTPAFLSKCSRFQSVGELFEASGFNVKSQEDFAAIPDDKWDDFIKKNTTYSSWQEMLNAAGAEWVKNQLGL
jgi:hypothetical protein